MSIRGNNLKVADNLVGKVVATLGEARKKLSVVGCDFTRPALDALRAGNVAALLYPSPERQLEAAVRALCDSLTGRPPEAPTLAVRQELVLKSNLESYL